MCRPLPRPRSNLEQPDPAVRCVPRKDPVFHRTEPLVLVFLSFDLHKTSATSGTCKRPHAEDGASPLALLSASDITGEGRRPPRWVCAGLVFFSVNASEW